MKLTLLTKIKAILNKDLYIEDGDSYYLPAIKKIIRKGDFFIKDPFDDYICICDIKDGYVRYHVYHPDGIEGERMTVESFCRRYKLKQIVTTDGLWR